LKAVTQDTALYSCQIWFFFSFTNCRLLHKCYTAVFIQHGSFVRISHRRLLRIAQLELWELWEHFLVRVHVYSVSLHLLGIDAAADMTIGWQQWLTGGRWSTARNGMTGFKRHLRPLMWMAVAALASRTCKTCSVKEKFAQ